MADTNQEQLLSDLLSGIARDDARLEAPHLESRVLTEVDASTTARRDPPEGGMPDTTYLAMAGAIAVALFTPALFWMNAEVARPTAGSKVAATEEVIAARPTTTVPNPSAPARAIGTRRSFPTRPSRPTNPTQPATPTRLTNPTSPYSDEFLPLMPMTEHELTGSFQLVRVQMPRASLGALRSPLEHPNELVEADVLLGEDGMARAIRLSTSGSIQPWRSR